MALSGKRIRLIVIAAAVIFALGAGGFALSRYLRDKAFGTITDPVLEVDRLSDSDVMYKVDWVKYPLTRPVQKYRAGNEVRYLVSLEDAAASLGYACDINGDAAVIRGKNFSLEVRAGAENALVNGKKTALPVPVAAADDMLWIDERSIGPAFSIKAGYLTFTNSIHVSSGTLEGKVAPYKNRNVFFVNGRPAAPIMYSSTEQGRQTWLGITKKSIGEFVQQGYDIIQTDMWFKYSLSRKGTFDIAGIRKQLSGILSIDPDARIFVRINVSAPEWWLQENPSEICKVTNPNPAQNTFGGNSAESLASDKYREFAEQYLRLFLQEVEKTPEGDHIIGYHIGGGVYGEWHYYGIYDEPDASEPMRQKFIAYAMDKYQTLEKINAAWKTDYKSTDEITVPSYQRRYEVTDGDFRDPALDRYVIDYYDCQHAVVSGLVNGLAKIVKETWTRPVITGVFYGYFYGAWTVGTQSSQFDIRTIFKSPYLDYFSGPLSSRNMMGSGIFRTLAESLALNGKVWVSEHDVGTYLDPRLGWPDKPQDEQQSIAIMKRNYMYTFTENAGQWWYDFGPNSQGGGWWSTPAMLSTAGKLLSMSERFLEQPYEKKSEILVVYDMDSFDYVKPARIDPLTFKITEDMSDKLLGTGTAFDRIFLMDLKLADLSKYKMVIFGNTFALSADDRAYIRDHVMKDGRSVVFMSGAGYTDGTKNDPALISDLTGMTVLKAAGVSPVATVTLGGKSYVLNANGVTSLFEVRDSSAQTIGTFGDGAVSAAVKTVNGCKVYYFGLPLSADVSFYKTLLNEAGARVYIENTVLKDYVTVGGGIIGIYSVFGGEKTVRPLNGSSVPITMEPYSTRYFDIETGEELTT